MIRLVHPTYIEAFVTNMVMEDTEVNAIIAHWELEKPMIVQGLLEHFYQLGLYKVYPSPHLEIVRDELILALKTSPMIRSMREKVQAEIAKARERNRGKV